MVNISGIKRLFPINAKFRLSNFRTIQSFQAVFNKTETETRFEILRICLLRVSEKKSELLKKNPSGGSLEFEEADKEGYVSARN